MGNYLSSTENIKNKLIEVHSFIDILCTFAEEQTPIEMKNNKLSRLRVWELFKPIMHISKKEYCVENINTDILRYELKKHITQWNQYFPEEYEEPSEYINKKSELLSMCFPALRYVVYTHEYNIKYNLYANGFLVK